MLECATDEIVSLRHRGARWRLIRWRFRAEAAAGASLADAPPPAAHSAAASAFLPPQSPAACAAAAGSRYAPPRSATPLQSGSWQIDRYFGIGEKAVGREVLPQAGLACQPPG